jgi:hypothetical protein
MMGDDERVMVMESRIILCTVSSWREKVDNFAKLKFRFAPFQQSNSRVFCFLSFNHSDWLMHLPYWSS